MLGSLAERLSFPSLYDPELEDDTGDHNKRAGIQLLKYKWMEKETP